MENVKLYSFMVNQIEAYTKRNGVPSRWEALSYFVGYYGNIDDEKFELINKLYSDGFLKE